MAEQWKPVVGYEGLYEVSDHGRVRSIERTVEFKDGRKPRTFPSVELRSNPQPSGHLYVNLSKSGKALTLRVHRLVLMAHGRMPEGDEVCRHLDGNPANNHVSNLAWGTVSENRYDTVAHGRHYLAIRESCPRGHSLAEPNLVAYELRQGHRKCKACHRGRSMCVKENDLSDERLKTNSDWQYARILGGN